MRVRVRVRGQVVVPLDGFKRFIVAKGDRDKLVKEVRP
jgi:hypothetical protein